MQRIPIPLTIITILLLMHPLRAEAVELVGEQTTLSAQFGSAGQSYEQNNQNGIVMIGSPTTTGSYEAGSTGLDIGLYWQAFIDSVPQTFIEAQQAFQLFIKSIGIEHVWLNWTGT